MPISRREFLKLAAFGLAAASYPTVIERFFITLNEYTLPLPRLPQAFDGFTLLQLTDIHYGPLMPLEAVEYVVWMANRGRQDVTVLTGDYVHRNHTAADIRTVWPVLNKLTAPEGVFAVLGNHDHWADTQASIRALKASGFNLRHRSHLFERQGQRLWLAGTGDLWEDEQTMDTVFAGVSDDDCKILLAHNPDTADLPFVTKIDLMLSGHTHGGQVYFPFIGAPWAPVRNKAYMRGLVQTRRFPLFVSRGIGWAGYPLRFLSPPEMALIILRRE